jgi:uncharacterized cupredoxin-like copper-binding protein
MSGLDRRSALVVALAVVVPMSAGFAVDATEASRPAPLGPGLVTVELEMHHSRFSPDEIRVYQGTLVRFEVVNRDPIHHELIVGPDRVHAIHESGHDAHHPPVPGEVSVKPGERGLTTYRFDGTGTVVFACHLPGHFTYGMSGRIEVVAPPS